MQMHTNIYVYMYIYKHINTYICIYLKKHTHTHTREGMKKCKQRLLLLFAKYKIPKNSLSQHSSLVAMWSEALVYRKVGWVSIPASSVLRV